jgi:hypothetical protein
MRLIYALLLLHILFQNSLFPIETSDKDDEIELEREFEVGIRGGIGYRGDDRLSNALENYKTYSGTGVYGSTSLSPFHISRNLEAYARTRWSTNSKAGFLVGSGNFSKFHLTEINTYPDYTRINFKLGTDYLFLTYHQEWHFKKFLVEGGIALGVNNTELSPSGYTISQYGTKELNGFMTASGLSYRLELGIKKKVLETVYFETGFTATMHTAPYFNGSFNDSLGSYYVKSDGSLELISNSQFKDSIAYTTIASRKLDMVYSVFQLYVGVSKRFSL